MKDDARLSTSIGTDHGIPVVRVKGEIDLYTAPEFEHALKEAIPRAERALVVDLSDLSYLDSAGLSALVSAYKLLSSRGADLYVVARYDQPGVCRVLEVTRLNMLIKVRSSLREVMDEILLPSAA